MYIKAFRQSRNLPALTDTIHHCTSDWASARVALKLMIANGQEQG